MLSPPESLHSSLMSTKLALQVRSDLLTSRNISNGLQNGGITCSFQTKRQAQQSDQFTNEL
jgi:hypothetical protein